jgi:catechol 2,3-dioxygenase-like lactoylglutathione lyase family enzyme
MSEVARVTVDYLLSRPDINGVEAWIDLQNTRSLGVARRAGLGDRGRLPLVYADRLSQTVVMARAATPDEADVLTVWPNLPVNDVSETASLLANVLGLNVLFLHGEPPGFGRLGIGPWSGSPGIELGTAEGGCAPTHVSVDIGISTDTVYRRALDAGLEVLGAPENRPWHRREFAFRLPEGHVIRIVGPLEPPATS